MTDAATGQAPGASIDAAAPAATHAPASPGRPPARGPRTRWAGIVWGLVLAATAAGALWLLSDPSRRAGASEWLLGLTPLSIVAYAILALGAVLLVAGVVGLAGRAQRLLAGRPGAASPAAAGSDGSAASDRHTRTHSET